MTPEAQSAIARHLRQSNAFPLLAFDGRGRAVWGNRYVEKLFGESLLQSRFDKIFQAIPEDTEFMDWLPQPDQEIAMDLVPPSGSPQVWNWQFIPAGEEFIAIGSIDSKKVEQLERTLIPMQSALSNRVRELHQTQGELELSHEYKNLFLGMAAHDLRTPLSVVQAYLEILLDEAAERLVDEHVEFLEIMHRNVHFMHSLVNDLLDVSKIESGKLRLEMEPLNLPEFITRYIAANKVLADKKEIRLAFDPPSSFPEISLDRSRFEQVMNNLLANAIKFSPRGSTITIGLKDENTSVVIEITDQGQGMNPQKLAQLFDPFARASSSSKLHIVGIGLLISKRIVEAQRGTMEVQSKVGAGTTFRLRFPA